MLLLFTPSRPRGLARRSRIDGFASTMGLNFEFSHTCRSDWLGCIIICDSGRMVMW